MKIFLWNLKDELRWVLLWTVLVGSVICFVVGLYPSFGETLEAFIGKTGLLKIFMGRFAPNMVGQNMFDMWLALQFFIYYGMLAGFYGLIYASNAIAGEVERQTMEMLLVQPVSRWRIILEKFAVVIVNMAVLCTLSFFILVDAISIWVDEIPSYRVYVYVFINKYFLLLVLTAFGFLCSVLVNGQRLAITVSIAALLFTYLVYKSLITANVGLWLARLMPYYYADATKVLNAGKLDWGDNLVLILVTVAFLAAALVLFRWKDIAK